VQHFLEDLDPKIEKQFTLVVERLKQAGVKVVENDGPEVTYDEAMTSFHILGWELKGRL
jgi:Asp-tRNA(Asn)/Glu-tRNA(Gln) amidotransferase A subunit family amidase